MQVQILAGMLDELEKIGVSYKSSDFMQSRRRTRPIRASTLISRSQNQSQGVSQDSPQSSDTTSEATDREALTQNPELDQPQFEGMSPEESGESSIGKEASVRTDKAIERFGEARPYVAGALKAGLPAAIFGNFYGGPKLGKTIGLVGAGAGLTNEFLKSWAQKNKRKAVARKILKGQNDAR